MSTDRFVPADTRRFSLRLGISLAAGLAAAGLALTWPRWTTAQDKDHDHGGPARKAENWGGPNALHLYLCAFHVAKDNPGIQIEAHHYCAPAGSDIHQCTIYDRRTSNAKLLGIEYIISDEAYQKQTAEEKQYWHPHAYEIVSGQLIAPDLPKEGDDIFPGLIDTWGKTWHTWPDPKTDYPTGAPLLMWSANGDGQIAQGPIDARDKQYGISTAAIRERRKAMGFSVPNIPPPKTMKDLGRRWTTSGLDTPTKTGGEKK